MGKPSRLATISTFMRCMVFFSARSLMRRAVPGSASGSLMAPRRDFDFVLRTRLLADMGVSGEVFKNKRHHDGGNGERKAEGGARQQPRAELLRSDTGVRGERVHTQLRQHGSEAPCRFAKL